VGTLLPSHVTLSLGHSIAGLHINCITTLLHAQRTVANFAACQHHKITILHILRVTALLHYCITALRPSRCCVVAVGITASLCYCRCNYYIGAISVTASLLAQRTVANFAACQHHRITIFHVLRVTALLHYCITAWEGPAVQFTQQMSATFTVSNIHFASL
jgi:hypothetical protein